MLCETGKHITPDTTEEGNDVDGNTGSRTAGLRGDSRYKMLERREEDNRRGKGKGKGERPSVALPRALSTPISTIVRGTNEATVTVFYFYSPRFFFSSLRRKCRARFTIARIAKRRRCAQAAF